MHTRRILHVSTLQVVATAAAIVVVSESIAAAQVPTDDASSELHARVEAYERAWNTHRGSALTAFFTQDADMIFGNGPTIIGREAIQKWWDAYFAGISATRRATFTIDSLRWIAPDVALMNVGSMTAGRAGANEQLPTRLARGTWVMVRQSSTWLIAAMRGLPAEGDARVAPGTDR